MAATTGIKLVIVDFGNVICSFDYRIFCARMAKRTGSSPHSVYTTLLTGQMLRAFEHGRMSGHEYHQRVMSLFEVDISYDEFFVMYGEIFTEIPGTVRMLERLGRRYPLYLLSDTNEIHFGYMRDKVGEVLSLFDTLILSYEVGVMKPDAGIFDEATRRSGLPPQACVFIDDRPANVDGARQVGMHAVQFTSPEQCAAELATLEVG